MAATPRTKTDDEQKLIVAFADVSALDDEVRAAQLAADEAASRRAAAEYKRAQAVAEAERLERHTQALAGKCGEELRELAELRIATRGTVARATAALADLVAAISELDGQTDRAATLSDIARSRGAAHDAVPQLQTTRPFVDRVANLQKVLGEFLSARAEGLR